MQPRSSDIRTAAIRQRRLVNQCITAAGHRRPADVVAWFGAVQAQEYDAAKWGVGLRLQDAPGESDVERAFQRGSILRTHLMRPTWHFVARVDIRWLLDLTAPRVARIMASYNRRLGLGAAELRKGRRIIERALGGGVHLTRRELGERLRRAGFDLDSQQLAHLMMDAELECVVCSGPRRGKQFTYALLAERAPDARKLPRDEALAELTRRYFRSHGPATVRDFVWWSGLTTADAKRGLEINGAERTDVDGRTYWSVGSGRRGVRLHPAHLLPIYDEYLVAYRDREAVPHGPPTLRSSAGGTVTFQHAVIVDGQIAGTWRNSRSAAGVSIVVVPLRPLNGRERHAVEEAANRYRTFLRVPLTFEIGPALR